MNGTLVVTSIPGGVRVAVNCLTLPPKLGIPLTIWKTASRITMEDLKEIINDPELLARVEQFLGRLSRLRLPWNLMERLSAIMRLFGRYFGHPIVRPLRGFTPSEIPSTLVNALILQLALQQKAVASVLCRAKAVFNTPWKNGRRQNPEKPYGERIACWHIEIINSQGRFIPVEPTLGVIGLDSHNGQAFAIAGYGSDLDGVVMVEGLPQEYAMDFSTIRMAPGLAGITGNVYLRKIDTRNPQLYTKKLDFTITASPAAGLMILPKEGEERVIVRSSL